MRLLLACLVLLTGCGGSSTTSPTRWEGTWNLSSSSGDAQSSTSINFRSETDYDGVYSDPRTGATTFFYVQSYRQGGIQIIFDANGALSSTQTTDYSVTNNGGQMTVEWNINLSPYPYGGRHTFTVSSALP